MIRRVQSSGRNAESGYALITILFLLGVVAVMLARSLPRDAMAAERTREETLIYRGEQYARAVKLYFRAHQRYPETLDDLEETDGVRFLRRRYRDPMTGDDEWRLIKMGTDGRFEDSLVYDTEKDDGAGGRTTPAAAAFAAAQQDLKKFSRTPNSVGAQRMSAAPSNPFQVPSGARGAFAFPGQPGAVNPDEQPQVRPDGQPTRGAEGDYSQVLPGQVPTNAGQRDPRLGPNGVPAAIAGVAPQQAPDYGGQPLPANAVSQATNLIGDLLTRPRPGGLAGLQGQMAPQQGTPAVAFQEGIAGVASKSERTGVKVYKDRESFNEWEFVYDYREDAQMGAMGAQTAPAAGGNINQGQPGLTPSGTLGGSPGARQGSPFGLPGMNTGTPQPGAPPVRREDPQPAPQEGGRRTRRTTRPRSPAEFRPATPVPPTPDDPAAIPGQVRPDNQGQN